MKTAATRPAGRTFRGPSPFFVVFAAFAVVAVVAVFAVVSAVAEETAPPASAPAVTPAPEAAPPARSYAPEAARRFTPYFNLGLSENLFIQETGDFFSGGLIKTNVGLLANITTNGNHSLFGMYTLDYDGPGFQPQDTKEWRYRSLDHLFSFEYRWRLSGHFRVRPGIVTSRSFTRTAANEIWGEGLYDSRSRGGQIALDYLLPKGALSVSYLQRKLEFPNYTDLLREFQNASNTAETAGGLNDQDIKEFGLSGYWGKLFAGIRSSAQDYKKQKVVDSSGVYGNTAQKDKTLSANAGFWGKLWRFEVQPSASYIRLRSNQNFIRYKFFGATDTTNGDVVFVPDNYSYKQYSLNIPFYFNITRAGTALNFGYAITRRVYENRPPRDANNDYDFSKKQSNLLNTLTFGFRKRLNDLAFMKLTYSTVVGTSNNKFEKYIPYNFTGQQVGMAFEVAY